MNIRTKTKGAKDTQEVPTHNMGRVENTQRPTHCREAHAGTTTMDKQVCGGRGGRERTELFDAMKRDAAGDERVMNSLVGVACSST